MDSSGILGELRFWFSCAMGNFRSSSEMKEKVKVKGRDGEKQGPPLSRRPSDGNGRLKLSMAEVASERNQRSNYAVGFPRGGLRERSRSAESAQLLPSNFYHPYTDLTTRILLPFRWSGKLAGGPREHLHSRCIITV